MEIEKEKQQALIKIFDWLKKRRKQYLTLGGYAGTGKTFLLGLFRQKLLDEYPDIKVAFCAFTGKASQVLNLRLKEAKAVFWGDKVGTIHSLIYDVEKDKNGQILKWVKRTEIDYGLIVIDEASMVSEEIWNDLTSYGIPILAVGDHGQLPPIGTNFNLMKKPEIVLEKIFRQVENSPIIKLSQEVRKTGRIAVGKFGPGVVKYNKRESGIGEIVQDLIESWNEETMFLVGINKSRIKLNGEIRISRDIHQITPVSSDRVICLKNNWQAGIYNGMLGTIGEIEDEKDNTGEKHWYQTDILMDDGFIFSGRISNYQFNNPQTVRDVEGLTWKEIGDLFDFGYALTVHKAQGSQARKVVLFEERNRYMDDEEWRRWLYTAVTRAQEELVIIGE